MPQPLRLMIVIALVAVSPQVFASDVMDITFSARNGGSVLFSHRKHLESQQINDNCNLCHEKIFKLDNRRPVTMAEMAKGKSCGACHGRIAFGLAECGRCHAIRDITFRVEPTGNVTFVHAPHTAKLACRTCHPRLFRTGRNRPVSMAEMEKGKSCGACHRGEKAFPLADCSRCHMAGNVLMKVTGAGPVTFSHSFHTRIHRCVDCHPKVFPLGYSRSRPRATMLDMDRGKSCGACHDDYSAFTTRENCVRCHNM
ncbi:MAG TPA: cytochrome c3 family protein [Geobacteraceae bacterium]|nr:cytochrome c3 family protein [Geobacteraceae bacterium]